MFSKPKPPSSGITQPTYILTDRLPSSQIPLLLGRIVADIASPTDEYIPEDPRPALTSKPLEIVDTDFSILFSGSKNTFVESKISHILGLAAQDGQNSTSSLQSKRVRTRTLPQHREALKALLGKFKPQILQLLRDNGGVAYMVVGVKSALDAEHAVDRQFGNRKALTVGLPTAAVVSAASHGTVNLGPGADVDVNVERVRGRAFESAGTMDGEQVFALRYRVLTLKKKLFLAGQGVDVDYGSVKRVAFEDGVYGDVEGGREEISEDEDDDDDDDDDEDDDDDIALNDKLMKREIKKRSDIMGVEFPE